MSVIRVFRQPAFSPAATEVLLRKVQARVPTVESLQLEKCFAVETNRALTQGEFAHLQWILAETFEPDNTALTSFLAGSHIIETGPRMNFTTPYATNAVAACHAAGITCVTRIEWFMRHDIGASRPLTASENDTVIEMFHDRMTECYYPEPLTTFQGAFQSEATWSVPLLTEGMPALERVNRDLGLAMDAHDLKFVAGMFTKKGRDPTIVEMVHIGQANSNHCRHHDFRANIVIDGVPVGATLMQMIKAPLDGQRFTNSRSAFCDNASAIKGWNLWMLVPSVPGTSSLYRYELTSEVITCTVETHNFPTGISPFAGAATGTGGRIRDNQAIGRGGKTLFALCGYMVGALNIPGYSLPWERPDLPYPDNMARPLDILIEASNGASQFGNEFGEPVTYGTTRSVCIFMPDGSRHEYVKPIMLAGGVGQAREGQLKKGAAESGMLVVILGGPNFRIGMGGGAASSLMQGENKAKLDFNAVQRGNGWMEQICDRVIAAGIARGIQNPIVAIHDLGAGGNCNAITEIVYPAGACVYLSRFPLGDPSLSAMEIWVNESQERWVILLRPEDLPWFEAVCEREGAPFAVVGDITGDGRIVLIDDRDDRIAASPETVVDMNLEEILGDVPRKTYNVTRVPQVLLPLSLPPDLTVREALERVLRALSVASKAFLTTKVDRTVKGRTARQQTVGPLQLPLADVAVSALTYGHYEGAASSIGERPLIGLVNPAAMARMSLLEMLMNLVWAAVSDMRDAKISANWMWAAKAPGELPRIVDTATALRDFMIALIQAADGGKDSFSMATKIGDELVKSPGTLVLTSYAPVPDVRRVITPDIKKPGESTLLFLDLSGGNSRLGGSVLAQVFEQVGNETPDMGNAPLLVAAFRALQDLIEKGLILAGHDVSDGGRIITLLEMAFAGNCGVDLTFAEDIKTMIPFLFAEEAGVMIEVEYVHVEEVLAALRKVGVPVAIVGQTTREKRIVVNLGETCVLDDDMPLLRDVWWETSSRIDELQANPACVREEREHLLVACNPTYALTFTPTVAHRHPANDLRAPHAAMIRDKGTNGDQEFVAALKAVGFHVADVIMSDITSGAVGLGGFQFLAFPGGFTYADVFDAGKAQAATIRFNERACAEFERFRARNNTLSLGICNGCQLSALMGWVPGFDLAPEVQPRFIRNTSERFESRFVRVVVPENRSVMFGPLAGSILGVWVAHGEGRLHCSDSEVIRLIIERGLVPLAYVDDDGMPTTAYPANPNGSPFGIGGLVSHDGRHVAVMPHPERCLELYNWPYKPEPIASCVASPWMEIFHAAYRWCCENR